MNNEWLGSDKWRIVRKGWIKKDWEGMNEWMKNSEKKDEWRKVGKRWMNEWRIVRKGWIKTGWEGMNIWMKNS